MALATRTEKAQGPGEPGTDVERVMAHHNVSREEAQRWLSIYPVEKLLPERGAGLTQGTTKTLAKVTDEEFVSQVAEYVASIPVSTFLRMKPGVLHEPILAMTKEKGYEDGPRFVRYMKTPEGQAFYMQRYRLAREARQPPARVEVLTEEEKRGVIDEFKQLMGREPTQQEMYELFAEESKLKQKVLIK